MTTRNGRLTALPILLLAATLFSCNGGDDKKAAPATADTTVTTAPAPAPGKAFKPFNAMLLTHNVKDFKTWETAFKNDSAARIANGIKVDLVSRNMDKPNSVFIATTVDDITKAKALLADPAMAAAMQKGGVTSKPEAQYFNILRLNMEAKEKTWVLITHRVKDFDTWLKAYDSEGLAARNAQGMNDAVLGRGIDDPNLVMIVFDIKDMAKAKAAIASEEKKKLMMSAGVEGMPTITFYKDPE